MTGDPKSSGCDGKKAFKTYPEAHRISMRLNKAWGAKSNAYRCEHCRFFHVGNRLIQHIRRDDTINRYDDELLADL